MDEDEDSSVRAKRYREHAAEIYAAAESVTHSSSRAALLRLAETYTRLAVRIETDVKVPSGSAG